MFIYASVLLIFKRGSKTYPVAKTVDVHFDGYTQKIQETIEQMIKDQKPGTKLISTSHSVSIISYIS